jgi:8-oxo-dGTP pyrophosphatase MutT (NUDIX family)
MSPLRELPLPPQLVAQAREYADGTRTPAEPRNAATVVLLRPGPSGPEVYLLQRQTSMAFAGGMCVFPGGGVDPRDFDDELVERGLWSGPSPAEWAARLGCDEPKARALVCAAVRETFEESGVLLAGPSKDSVVGDTTGADWEADRVALETRELGFSEFLHRRGLVLRADLLGPWAHWITPEFEPKRYDTAFFVAALPAGQVTRDVTSESDQVTWIRPADAVAAVDAGEMLMLPPTYLCCHELAQYDDVAAILDAAGEREIRAIMPTVRVDGDRAYLETT